MLHAQHQKRRMFLLSLGWVLFCALFLCVAASYATTPASSAVPVAVGQIVWVKGSVEAVTKDGEKINKRVLTRQSPVYQGDEITTSKTSSGQIVFSDGSLVSLRSGTKFVIEQYHYEKSGDSKANKFVAGLVEGGFRTVTGFISKSNRDGYQVKTPVATIGVRGTDYSLFYRALSGLSVKLNTGAIAVINDAGMTEMSKENNYIYAQIRGLNTPVEKLSTAPTVFQDDPPIVPAAPATVGESTTSTGAAGAAKGPGGGGGADEASGTSESGTSAAPSADTSTSSGSSTESSESSAGTSSTASSDTTNTVGSASTTQGSTTVTVSPNSASGGITTPSSSAGFCIK